MSFSALRTGITTSRDHLQATRLRAASANEANSTGYKMKQPREWSTARNMQDVKNPHPIPVCCTANRWCNAASDAHQLCLFTLDPCQNTTKISPPPRTHARSTFTHGVGHSFDARPSSITSPRRDYQQGPPIPIPVHCPSKLVQS